MKPGDEVIVPANTYIASILAVTENGLKPVLVEPDLNTCQICLLYTSLGKFIHSTSSDIEEQKKWIRAYKKREQAGTDYYFIFFKDGVPVGLNRLYWIKEDSYTSGSWVFSPDAPFECAIAAALIVRIIAFEILGKKVENALDGCHKDHVKVLRFNKMIGLEITGTIQDVKGCLLYTSRCV